VHAQRVFVVLAYATSPLRPGEQDSCTQLLPLHQYRPGGEATNAVCSSSAEVHAGSPATVLLWI
jgi:hypothetical protein